MKGADQRSNINDELSPDEKKKQEKKDPPQQQLLFLDSEAYRPAVKKPYYRCAGRICQGATMHLLGFHI